uniref:glutathione transferase n=1 Tax=Sinocyclocheilus anshuiensis TaxID=1608454 RepID=A0A671LJZ3_9TELE
GTGRGEVSAVLIFCRAVLIFLKDIKIPHKVENIAIRKGEQLCCEYDLNPNLYKTYISLTAYNVPDHWYPKLPEKRTRVDECMAWNHALLPCMGQPTNPEKLEKVLADLDGTLDKLENVFLKNQPFLCGDDISLADLLAVCELMQPLCGGRDILKDRPKLLSWRSRVHSVLSDSFDEAHSVVYQIREKFTAKLSPCSKQQSVSAVYLHQ